jgi:hypothetical protein
VSSKRVLGVLRALLILFGAALLILLLWRLGPRDVLEQLRRIGWYAIPLLFLYAAYQAARALALHWCLPGPMLIYRDALAIRLSGEALQSLTFTGPLLAEPTKAWLLARHGLTLQQGFAATLTEYLICSFVTAGMAIAGLLYLVMHFEAGPTVSHAVFGIAGGLAAFLIAAAIAIRRRFYLIGTIISGLAAAGILRGRLRPDLTWINGMEDLLLAILRDRPARFMAVALAESAAQAFLVLELFWLLQALALEMPRSYPLVIEASTKIVDFAFMFIPLQLGAAEGTYALVFRIVGLPAAAGFAVAFVRRLRTLVVAAIGLAVFARQP